MIDRSFADLNVGTQNITKPLRDIDRKVPAPKFGSEEAPDTFGPIVRLVIIFRGLEHRDVGQRRMLNCSVWLAMTCLTLCVTSSVGAQENVKQGKALYSSECEQCHKLPQNVTAFHGGVDLETFLGEQHYATPESAAAIAAYLRAVEKLPLPRRRPPPGNQAASRTLTEAPQQASANTPLERALNSLLGPSPPQQFNYRVDWPTREQ